MNDVHFTSLLHVLEIVDEIPLHRDVLHEIKVMRLGEEEEEEEKKKKKKKKKKVISIIGEDTTTTT